MGLIVREGSAETLGTSLGYSGSGDGNVAVIELESPLWSKPAEFEQRG